MTDPKIRVTIDIEAIVIDDLTEIAYNVELDVMKEHVSAWADKAPEIAGRVCEEIVNSGFFKAKDDE